MRSDFFFKHPVAGVLDLFIVLRSRMSGVGSLGLDSTLHHFMHEWQVLSRGIDAPLELYPQPRVAPRSVSIVFSLQIICALEKKQAANKLIISPCIPITSALLLCYCYMACTYCQQRSVRACTLLLYHHCCMYCIRTAVNVPHPQNSRCHVPRRFLELGMA